MLNAIPEVVTGGLNIAGGSMIVGGWLCDGYQPMMRAGYLMPFFYLGFVTAASQTSTSGRTGCHRRSDGYSYIQLSPKYNRVAGGARSGCRQ